jgi:hypothetical protein
LAIESEDRTVGGDDTPVRTLIVSAGADARMLVDAPPGTGKTHLAAARLGALIKDKVSPGQVLVLSFSRSAVRTLTKRLALLSDERTLEELRYVSIRTFDSWAFRILSAAGAPVEKLLASGYDTNIAVLTALMSGPKRDTVRNLIGDRRHIIVDEFQDLPGVRGELVLALMGLIAPPGKGGAGFTVLGDPSQAIYGFAARNGGKRFPTPRQYWSRITGLYGDELKSLTLIKNYRATGSVAALSAGMRAILTSDLSEEEKYEAIRVKMDALPAAGRKLDPSWLAPSSGSKAILTRSNGEALAVLRKLFGQETAGWETRLRLHAANHAGLPPAWIGALLRKLRAPVLPRSQFDAIYDHLTTVWDEAQRKALELPDRDTAWTRLVRAAGTAASASSLTLASLRARLTWPDAFPDDQQAGDDGLIVTTIHQSKGMEFDVVSILGAESDDDDENEEEEEDDGAGDDAGGNEGGDGEEVSEEDDAAALEEEANIAYVAVTRAAQSVELLPPDSIFGAPRSRDFQHGRERFCHINWRTRWVNLELGLRGDIDPASFADPALHGGAAGVETLQAFLLQNARSLEGRKVFLKKFLVDQRDGGPHHAFYDVHLQEGTGPGLLLARTTRQVTYDLLRVLGSKYSLPSKILNLRISAVGTIAGDANSILAEPERTSRLWLGVALFGTGDFMRFKKGAS